MHQKHLLPLLLLISLGTFAQKEALQTQYLMNPLAINPAYAGTRQDFHLNAMFRRQFFGVGIQTPTSQSLAMDGAVAKGKVGIGFMTLNDRLSPISNTALYGSVAYHYSLSETQTVSFGVQGSLDFLPLFGGLADNTAGNVGFGVYYKDEKMFAGVARPEALRRVTNLRGVNIPIPNSRPLFINAGYLFDLNENTKLLASTLIYTMENQPLGFDLSGAVWFGERASLGLSFRRQRISFLQISAQYQLSKNVLVALNYNSKTLEYDNAFAAGQTLSTSPVGRGIFEATFRFVPNPTKHHYF